MRRTKSALMLLVVALAGSWGVASAQPAADTPQQAAPALLTLTTIPSGWSERVDLRPLLQVYADGRAVQQPDAASTTRAADTPPQRLTGTVPGDVLNAALAETKSLAALDLGMPGGTDQGTQIIDLMQTPPDQDVHLLMYSPDATENLTPEQQANRKRFTDLYRKLLDAFTRDH
ncbi:hypothetical protein [Nocardia anaemiae]|uniref:hypothetical protein n=1 Tax=Nocardia anaemiae TaxID=263910 RepID=UPI0007A46E9E|nr:hypothetical protein [Nocardia anaemiae]